MSVRTKSKTKDNEFSLAIKQWLSSEVTGHLGAYMYTNDDNDKRWKNGHSSKSYYLGRDDKATFDIALKELDIQAANFFDLGPGGEASVRAKTLPITRKINAKNYYPVDLSAAFAHSALTLMKDELKISGTPIASDFFKPLSISRPDSLIAIMGGTIGNFETYIDVKQLQSRLSSIFVNYRNAISSSGYFLVSFDANNNAQEIVDSYNSLEFNELIMGRLSEIIDTSEFAFEVLWKPENYQLALGVRSKIDQFVSFEDEKFAIEKNEFLPVLNSYRFPVPFVIKAAGIAGWKHLHSWSATGRTHYLLFATE